MLVALHRERFVTTLVNMTQTDIASVLLPAPRVGGREALHEGRQIGIALGPQKWVLVVRHQRVSANSHWRCVMTFPENSFEGLTVHGLLEQLHPRHVAIQDVKNHSATGNPRRAWHQRSLATGYPSSQYRTCPAFALCPSARGRDSQKT
jgi:hypothetical protein